jgi:release factor glutamine methyltransferase
MFLCCMETVKDAYHEFRLTLAPLYGVQEADAIASMVLTELTSYSKAKLKAFLDDPLTEAQQQRAYDVLKDLATGKPVQYVLGHAHFYGLDFKVSSAVLIPRPETEELVQWILETMKGSQPQRVLDIGTGSGCIPITIKNERPDSKLFAIDISPDALAVAQANAHINNVDVKFVEADILNLQAAEILNQTYHIIVSNPPYVTETDKLQMHTNVTDFEPHTALFVSDTNPLIFYKSITEFASVHLFPGSYLFFEINESYGMETLEMMKRKGFVNAELRQDLMGKDRMIRAQLPNA